MPTIIPKPSIIKAAGNQPKLIEEFIGRINSSHTNVSVAQMKSPQGWIEPGQTPEFEEITLVLSGTLKVETKQEIFKIKAGQAIVTQPGEWIRYSTPYSGGAEYIAICIPAFSPDTVHRDTNG